MRRSRRDTRQVRELILDAARELFVERGFWGVTTRDIAARADVVEVVIYSNFGSKAGLFEAAVVEPAERVLVEFVDVWTPPRPDSGTSDGLVGCLSALYDTLRRHRGVIGAVLAAQTHDVALAERARRRVRQVVLTVLEHGPGSTDPSDRAVVELALGGVLSAAIHGELLHAEPEAPSEHALAELLVRCFAGRGGGDG